MRVSILLVFVLHCLYNCTSGARVVVTFANAPSTLEGNTTVGGLSVVKQYGRRLVLLLPYTRDSLLDSELEVIGVLGAIERVENDTTVLVSSSASAVSERAGQWNLYAPYGIHPPQTTPQTKYSIAILDSGFSGSWNGSGEGWDFVSDLSISGDGDGRDPNATDPGAVSDECPIATWHGTKVASIISGLPAAGLDGVSPGTPIASVRVLGLCDSVSLFALLPLLFVCSYVAY